MHFSWTGGGFSGLSVGGRGLAKRKRAGIESKGEFAAVELADEGNGNRHAHSK